MKNRQFMKSALALLLVLASLFSMLPAVFAAEETERQQVTINADDLIADMEQTEELAREEAEAAAQEYEDDLVQQLCDQYDIPNEEPEDSEFGYLTDEEMREVGLEPIHDEGPATKDVRNETNFAYIFLDFKVGSASRGWNWQIKSDDTSASYHSANMQGAIAADYMGTDAQLYMPLETDDTYITNRLNGYQIKSGDIARIYVNSITANSQFVANGTKTADSYFAVHTSDAPGEWKGFAGAHAKITFKSGAQTLTWNVASSRVGDTLYGIRWDPSQSELTEAARIYVDYIYIGPAATAPVLVQFRNEANDGNLTGGGGYVGYGKKAPAFSTGKVNSETSTTQTIWGWAVHQQINGTWTNMNQFITDPSTFTCKNNTRFVLTSVTVRKETLNSTQTYNNGASTEDDKYVLTVDGFDTAELNLGGYGTPLDVAIVMDRSGSQGEFTWKKNFGASAKSSLTTYLKTLSKMVHPGYYRATCFRKNKHNEVATDGISGYLFSMPMRYYRGKWEMQYLVNCTCNGTSYRDYGVYTWNSTGMKQCSHVKWITVEAAYDQFVADAKTTGYAVGSSYTINGKKETLYFTLGASRLGKCQDAIENFLIKLYNSSTNLKPGDQHTVSVIGYGSTVFMENYPYWDGDGSDTVASNYKTANNYSATTITSQTLTYSTYEDVLKAINNTYIRGATRTDCAFQVLSGTKSAIESTAGKAITATKTDYLPASKAGRKRLVILLTDGVPSSNLEFNATVANAAVKASALLKDDSRTTVYCIGVMDGLDANHKTIYNDSNEAHRANDFLNAMSSRYRNAQVWNTGGTLTDKPYYFSDTAGGGNIATQMGTIWDSNAATLAVSGKSGPASLWLYEDYGREWKPDTADTVKIWAAPYTGNGTYGAKVLIGEHKVADNTKNQDFTGNGYILHYYYDAADQSFTYALQWTDAKTAFLRETVLSTGSKAKALSGTLNTNKGYKVYMEMPIEVDRNNTLGGNNIPLTTTASGCYQAKDANDTAIGTKLYSYSQPNANVYCSVEAEPHDYFISMEDYINLITSTGSDELKSVLDEMIRMPENLVVKNAHGKSNLDYLSFDVQLKTSSGTVLYHKAADKGATSLKYDSYNITDGLVELADDQTFTMVSKMTYASHNTDSYGRAPYADVNTTFYPTYYVPKFVVADYGDSIAVPMGLEGQNASKISNVKDGTLNASNQMVFAPGNSILTGNSKATYTYTTDNTPKEATSNAIAREVTIIPANVMTYDDNVISFGNGWSTTGTRTTIEQTADNAAIHGGYDAKYITGGDFHGSVQVAEVSSTSNSKQAQFTFTGTGFELISRTTKDSGVIVAEIFKGTEVKEEALLKSILCNTYSANADYNQVPVIRWNCTETTSGNALPVHGTYTVRLTAYYHVAFALDGSKNPLTDEEIREIMGYGEDVDFTYIPAEDTVSTRALRTSYKAYVDGIRIFNTVEVEGNVLNYTYGLANELNADFADMQSQILDSTNWTGGQANGALYLADKNINADSDDTTDSNTDGFPLFMDGSIKLEKVNVNGEDRIYFLNIFGSRYTYNGKEFWSMYRNGGYGYYYDNPNATANAPYLALSRSQVRTILDKGGVFYSSKYRALGSKTEIQLQSGSGIAFKADGSKVYLSLRSLDGKPCQVQVWNGSAFVDFKDPVSGQTLNNLTSATEMFYDFSAYNTTNGIIIKNAGSGILSVVHVKTQAGTKGIYVDQALAIRAAEAFETPIDGVVTDELKLYHSLNLQSNISINYIVSKAALEAYDDYSVTCEVGGKTYVLAGVEKGEYIYFTLDCLNAAMMNDNVRAVLTAHKGEEIFESPADDYSIADYCFSMMNRGDATEQFKRVCANLLRYGAATQAYTGYNAEAPADEELSEEQRAYLVDLDTVEFGAPYTILTDVAEPSVTWYGRTLMLDSTVGIKLAVDASAYKGNAEALELRVSYMGIDGVEKTMTVAPTVQNAEYGLYMFTINCLNAAELRAELTCQVYANGEAVSQTMIYSAASYGNGKTGVLLDLCKALFAYVDEARAFFS